MKKNDNCFVEQKNLAVARRAVGYARYDTKEKVHIINDFYDVLRLYVNFFQPSAKLISKERIDPKVESSTGVGSLILNVPAEYL